MPAVMRVVRSVQADGVICCRSVRRIRRGLLNRWANRSERAGRRLRFYRQGLHVDRVGLALLIGSQLLAHRGPCTVALIGWQRLDRFCRLPQLGDNGSNVNTGLLLWLLWLQSPGTSGAGLAEPVTGLDRGCQCGARLAQIGAFGLASPEPVNRSRCRLLKDAASSRLPFQGLAQLQITGHQRVGAVLPEGTLQAPTGDPSDLRG